MRFEMRKLIFIIILFCVNIAYAAEVKWTAKTELTTPASADIMLCVDDPGGSPVSKKMTLGNLFTLIDTSTELSAILGDETGTGALVFGTSPTFTTSIKITGGDSNPASAGEMRYDNSITGMSGGGVRWYDNDSVRLVVDLETDPSTDDYIVAYDADADGFYMKADATGAGGSAIVYDLGDDGGDDSVDVDEISIINDTGGVWSEPDDDEIQFNGTNLVYTSEIDTYAEILAIVADVNLLSESSDDTLTNKTFNADGTNNDLSNIDEDNCKSASDLVRGALEFVIDGGGSAIGAGIAGDIEIPFNCTIIRCTMLADQSGSITVDMWVDTYANYPPTNADSITDAGTTPLINASTKSQDTTLASWTTSLTAGSTIRYNVDSCSTITRCVISLIVEK
jgi:hypothetical protein